jgi:hypothetical protein
MKITKAELEAARHYLQQQLETHSWRPKEQPGEARHEFTLMKANAILSMSGVRNGWIPDNGGYLQRL